MFKPVSLLAVLALGGLPTAALACACCADAGARFQDQVELGEWEISEISRLAPVGPAQLYQSACGLDCVGGIENPQTTYDVDIKVTENGMAFTLGGATGRGAAWYSPGRTIIRGSGPIPIWTGKAAHSLYRTAVSRHRGRDRRFRPGWSIAAELVLSGFGNMCITAQSFSGWTLSVADETAQYRLFGQISGY